MAKETLNISEKLSGLSWITKISVILALILTPCFIIITSDGSPSFPFSGIFALVLIFYILGMGITELLIIFKQIKVDLNQKLEFGDWYSHIRFWSFFLWFIPLFWIYALIKSQTTWEENDTKPSFVKDRFYIHVYYWGFFTIALVIGTIYETIIFLIL